MTQIPFIEDLGDAIETAIADHLPAAVPARWGAAAGSCVVDAW